MTWSAELLGDVDDAGRLELGDLTLEDVHAIVLGSVMDGDNDGLAAFLWRILEELRELREQLADHRRADAHRRTR